MPTAAPPANAAALDESPESRRGTCGFLPPFREKAPWPRRFRPPFRPDPIPRSGAAGVTSRYPRARRGRCPATPHPVFPARPDAVASAIGPPGGRPAAASGVIRVPVTRRSAPYSPPFLGAPVTDPSRDSAQRKRPFGPRFPLFGVRLGYAFP